MQTHWIGSDISAPEAAEHAALTHGVVGTNRDSRDSGNETRSRELPRRQPPNPEQVTNLTIDIARLLNGAADFLPQ